MPFPNHTLLRNGLRAYGFHQIAVSENIHNSGFRIENNMQNIVEKNYSRLIKIYDRGEDEFHSLNFKALSLICVKFQFSGKRVPPTVKSDC